MKYDIQTLLALSQNARPEIERFRAQALGQNLPQKRKGNFSALSERSTTRSRQTSNFSNRSELGSSISGPSLRLPSRQPKNPPRGTLAQNDTGFARFLKEHSSPKHQRVTAGGRIVPMDPSTPAPKMKPLVKKADTKDGDGGSNALPRGGQRNRAQRRSSRSTGKGNNTSDVPGASGILVDQVKLANGNGALAQYLQAPGVFPNLSPASIAPTMLLSGSTLPFGSQLLQAEQQTEEYLKALQDCAGYGFSDRIWLPGTNQSMYPQNSAASFLSALGQPHSSVSGLSPDFSTGANFIPMAPSATTSGTSFDYICSNFGATGFPLPNNQIPLISQPVPGPGASQGGVESTTVQGAIKEYEALSGQLARLDRYMALHTWDLDPHSKKLLVEQRMSLVRELDTVRLYKEQLELGFGQVKYTNAQKGAGTRASTGQLPLGDFTNQAVQIPRFSAPGTNSLPVTLSGPGISTGYQYMLPVNEQISTGFQWPSKGNLYSFDNGLGFGELATISDLYEPEKEYYEEEYSMNPVPEKQSVRCSATNSNNVEHLGGNDDWEAPTKPAPPDISRIYRKIEEATARGVPIDGLLQELATVTTKLARKASEGRNGSSHVAPNPSSKKTVSPIKCDPSATEPGRIIRAHPRTHAIGRLWKSEEHVPVSNSPGNTPYETDNEDEAESCASSLSTTNSWATIQDGGKQWNMEKAPENENNGEAKDKPLNENNGALEQAAPVNSQASNLRDIIDLIQKANVDKTSRKPSSTSTKQSCHQLLTPCFDKDPSLNPRKSAALAVSQTVNAHAFLPPFDGAWDSPALGSYQDSNGSGNNTTQEPNQVHGLWNMRKDRTRPSPAVLREFFTRIEEEERSMVQRYQTMDPVMWQLG
ncbi:hypothetical protein PHISCL_09276 [Aspergillus sclerotialis]|uniref:Uncharacterized protein n=1 Tax=Aspergillus sclerotialis TaxID=2070753 RepID=A0A3A2Z5L1_9EURO|nr:hypothetical protein PHISCL_09276 [Aspergillus sclerotialis]